MVRILQTHWKASSRMVTRLDLCFLKNQPGNVYIGYNPVIRLSDHLREENAVDLKCFHTSF